MTRFQSQQDDGIGRFRPLLGAGRSGDGFGDLDWSSAVPVSQPDEMKRAGLARAGFSGDSAFAQRFESVHRAWMASQFLNGEAAAAALCDSLSVSLPDPEARAFAGLQAQDEHRHHAVLRRFVRERTEGCAFAPADSFAGLVRSIEADTRWDMQMLGLQIVIESLALATFRLTAISASDPVLRGIATGIAVEEERHVGFGLAMLGEAGRDWTAPERREREDFVLHAVELLSARYLMGDFWERLGVDRSRGERFTRGDPMMAAFRRTVFGRVLRSVAELGLLGPGVRKGFEDMGLSWHVVLNG
jgi:hypothetical protein